MGTWHRRLSSHQTRLQKKSVRRGGIIFLIIEGGLYHSYDCLRVKKHIICFDRSVSSQLVSRLITQGTGVARAVDPCDLINAASTNDGCPVRMHMLSPNFLQCG